VRKIDLSNFRVATSETARDINRRIVLNLIRSHQPVSRADLARHSGLQRSTVSVITEQLIQENWVKEGIMGIVPRGRRPRFLHLCKERVGIIGVDVRPVTTTVVLSDIEAHFELQESFSTPRKPEEFIAQAARCVRRMIKARPKIAYEGIGLSLPGRVDLKTRRLVFAPNLIWSDLDLKASLERATELPVELENAANACALAEVWFGRHTRAVRNLVAITVSEGIGAGLILNHQLVQGSSGLAGEFGHTTIIEDGLECRCGNRGCWEVYASNLAALRYYAESTKSSRHATTFDEVLRLAEQDDPKAVAAIQKMGRYLGSGLAMLATGLAPDLIVVIGEVTRVWNHIDPIITATVHSRLPTRTAPRILPSDPVAQSRLVGAIALVLQRHFGAPAIA
jgi:predicted NBD/HSP70 family sugar kinase